jgi:hypothetical protein
MNKGNTIKIFKITFLILILFYFLPSNASLQTDSIKNNLKNELISTQQKLIELGYLPMSVNMQSCSQPTIETDPVLFALSIDALADQFPSASPYNAMDNDPVNKIDLDGNESGKTYVLYQDNSGKVTFVPTLLLTPTKGQLHFEGGEGNVKVEASLGYSYTLIKEEQVQFKIEGKIEIKIGGLVALTQDISTSLLVDSKGQLVSVDPLSVGTGYSTAVVEGGVSAGLHYDAKKSTTTPLVEVNGLDLKNFSDDGKLVFSLPSPVGTLGFELDPAYLFVTPEQIEKAFTSGGRPEFTDFENGCYMFSDGQLSTGALIHTWGGDPQACIAAGYSAPQKGIFGDFINAYLYGIDPTESHSTSGPICESEVK